MCSIGEDDFGDDGGVHSMIENVKSVTIEDEMCKKCLVEKAVIKIDFKDQMCQACCLYFLRHKFRATLGASKIIKRNSNVLLSFNGSSTDVCLLHMIKFGFEEEVFKRLCFNLKIVYLDESCVDMTIKDVDTIELRMKRIQEIKEIMKQFPNFICAYSTIADSTKYFEDIQAVSENDIKEIVESEKKFFASFNSFKSLTTKQDFLQNTKMNCLRDLAIHLNCTYVFLTDIAIDLAKKLISNIALGRGSSVACDVAFCDDKITALKFVRPIKDLSPIEIESYIKFNNLKVCSPSSYGIDSSPFASIQNLTSQFIDGLQENYSSTVSTVYKCCSKIAPTNKIIPPNDTIPLNKTPTYITDINQRCLLCKSLLDYHQSETLYAVEFSRCVSEVANDVEKLENIRPIQEKSIDARNGDNSHNKFLCRGCRNIFSEIDSETVAEIL